MQVKFTTITTVTSTSTAAAARAKLFYDFENCFAITHTQCAPSAAPACAASSSLLQATIKCIYFIIAKSWTNFMRAFMWRVFDWVSSLFTIHSFRFCKPSLLFSFICVCLSSLLACRVQTNLPDSTFWLLQTLCAEYAGIVVIACITKLNLN